MALEKQVKNILTNHQTVAVSSDKMKEIEKLMDSYKKKVLK